MEAIRFFGGGAYLDAYYTNFPSAGVQVPVCDTNGQPNGLVAGTDDLSGQPLAQAAKWTGFLGATLKGEITSGWKGDLTGFVRYSSSNYFMPGGGGPLRADRQPAFTTAKLSGRIILDDERYEIGFYIDNRNTMTSTLPLRLLVDWNMQRGQGPMVRLGARL